MSNEIDLRGIGTSTTFQLYNCHFIHSQEILKGAAQPFVYVHFQTRQIIKFFIRPHAKVNFSYYIYKIITLINRSFLSNLVQTHATLRTRRSAHWRHLAKPSVRAIQTVFITCSSMVERPPELCRSNGEPSKPPEDAGPSRAPALRTALIFSPPLSFALILNSAGLY